MFKQRSYKPALRILLLISVLTGVYCYKNRFTKTEEEYTYTYYYFENDELKSKAAFVMNKYDDRLSYTDETYITYPPKISHYYYKYDKSGNKKLCIRKDWRGDTESKEVLKYDRKGNCIYHKTEDDDGYSIYHTDYNEKGMKIKEETEIHDLKYDAHNFGEYYYDDNDRIVKELNTQFDDCFYEYDENGLLKSLKKTSVYGWSSEEKYEYDKNGLLLRTTHYSSDNTLYYEIKYTYNDENELVSEVENHYRDNDENDIYETRYTYAPNGKKASETFISNGTKMKYISYEYDDKSNLVKESYYKYYER